MPSPASTATKTTSPRPHVVPPGATCHACGITRIGEGYAIPARRTDTGKLALARSGTPWYCAPCAVLALREGR